MYYILTTMLHTPLGTGDKEGTSQADHQEMETPESLLADEQISKIWCPYTIEYDAVLEEILTYYNMDEPWEYYVK